MNQDVRDYGTAELHKRHKIHVKNGTARIYAQLPLDLFREKMTITEDQWFAGDRLSYLFTASNLFRLRTAEYTDFSGRVNPPEGLTPSETHQIQYKEAMKALHNSHRSLVRNVCCFHAHTSNIGDLRDGLNNLARHFGIIR